MAKKGKKTQPQAKAKPENIEVEIEDPRSKFQQAKDYVKEAPGKAYDAAADRLKKVWKKGEKDLEESKDLPSLAQAQAELMIAGILAMGAKGVKAAFNGGKWVYDKVKSKPVGNIKLESESTSKQEKKTTIAQRIKQAVSKKLTRKPAPGAKETVAKRKLARAQQGAASKLANAKKVAIPKQQNKSKIEKTLSTKKASKSASPKAAKKNVVAKPVAAAPALEKVNQVKSSAKPAAKAKTPTAGSKGPGAQVKTPTAGAKPGAKSRLSFMRPNPSTQTNKGAGTTQTEKATEATKKAGGGIMARIKKPMGGPKTGSAPPQRPQKP